MDFVYELYVKTQDTALRIGRFFQKKDLQRK